MHAGAYVENRRDVAASGSVRQRVRFEELFERAQIAFDGHLGAGSMVYLRKIFEIVTSQAAAAIDIPTKYANGRRKTFQGLYWKKWMPRSTHRPSAVLQQWIQVVQRTQ